MAMADKKKAVSHSAAWWANARHEYIAKNDMLYDSHPDWEYICPFDFYRALFPDGFLEEKGVMPNWNEPGGGRPNGIILQITNRRHRVKTKSGKVRMAADVERYTLTDDLDAIMERVNDSNDKNETVFCAPVSYFGKNRNAANARFLHAFTIDLDGVGTEQLGNILKQIRNGYDQSLPLWTSLPQPTFIVNSGTGLHLYYLLGEPIPLVPHIVPFLQSIKEKLTDYVWRDTTSTLEEKQFQGIYQSFRMVGTPTKLNGRKADSKRRPTEVYEAVAFAHNGPDGKPYRCDIEYLLRYAGSKNRGKDMEMLLELKGTGGRTPIEQAKEKWPEWYNRRIVEGAPAGRWVCKRDLYDWWLGQIEAKATDHHRYWCLNALAAYADKCGVSYDELERDALALVPHMESLTVREDNHFTDEDALSAISSYGDGIIHKLHRDRIERRTQIEIPANKRNGRKQMTHIAIVNNMRKFARDELGEDSYANNGRPKGSGTKCDAIRDYAADHPEANHSEIARALGVSRPTVIKWLKPGWRSERAISKIDASLVGREVDGMPWGAWRDDGGIHVDMTEILLGSRSCHTDNDR